MLYFTAVSIIEKDKRTYYICDNIWPADVPHGRPHHPDHRLHGQVVPGKGALLHCASLHGEIMMIMMVVVMVVMIDDDGDLVMMMTKYVTVYLQCLFAGSLCIHINIQHDCNCSGQVFLPSTLPGHDALYASKPLIICVCRTLKSHCICCWARLRLNFLFISKAWLYISCFLYLLNHESRLTTFPNSNPALRTSKLASWVF